MEQLSFVKLARRPEHRPKARPLPIGDPSGEQIRITARGVCQERSGCCAISTATPDVFAIDPRTIPGCEFRPLSYMSAWALNGAAKTRSSVGALFISCARKLPKRETRGILVGTLLSPSATCTLSDLDFLRLRYDVALPE